MEVGWKGNYPQKRGLFNLFKKLVFGIFLLDEWSHSNDIHVVSSPKKEHLKACFIDHQIMS